MVLFCNCFDIIRYVIVSNFDIYNTWISFGVCFHKNFIIFFNNMRYFCNVRLRNWIFFICGFSVRIPYMPYLYLFPKLVRDPCIFIRNVMDFVILAYVRTDCVRKLMNQKRCMLFLRIGIDDNTVVFGTNSTALLLYSIPENIYSRFTAKIYGDDTDQLTLSVINNGVEFRSLEVEKNREYQIDISNPGGTVGFKITSTAVRGKVEIRNGVFLPQ